MQDFFHQQYCEDDNETLEWVWEFHRATTLPGIWSLGDLLRNLPWLITNFWPPFGRRFLLHCFLSHRKAANPSINNQNDAISWIWGRFSKAPSFLSYLQANPSYLSSSEIQPPPWRQEHPTVEEVQRVLISYASARDCPSSETSQASEGGLFPSGNGFGREEIHARRIHVW